MPQQRLPELDRAKGIGIFLVVVGHLVARGRPPGNDWFMFVEDLIYRFHMPYFMFLSGLVMGVASKPVTSVGEYGRFVRERALRLLPGYFLFAILIFAGKRGSEMFLHVDNPVSGFGDFLTLFYSPMHSYSAYLWYVYLLFLLCAALPVLLWATRGSALAMLAVAAAAYAIRPPALSVADQFCHYLLYFVLGYLAGRRLPLFSMWVDRFRWPALAVFAIALTIGVFQQYPKLITGLIAIPALYGLARWRPTGAGGLLEWWGKLSYPIYLMNTLAIGLVKGVLFKFTDWNGPRFFLFLPVLIAAGLFIPILIRTLIFKRIPVLERITR